MNFIRQVERLQLLIKLIEQERTGTPEELAVRLQLSKRQLHNQLETLKSLGASIQYSKKTNSYSFMSKKIDLRFSLILVEGDELTTIYGGSQETFYCLGFKKISIKVLDAI